MRWKYASACACIDWLTSQSMTIRRGLRIGRTRTRWIGSNPVRRARATVGRSATREPAASTAVRRLRRVGQVATADSSQPPSNSMSPGFSSSNGVSISPSNALGSRCARVAVASDEPAEATEATEAGSVIHGSPPPSTVSPTPRGNEANEPRGGARWGGSSTVPVKTASNTSSSDRRRTRVTRATQYNCRIVLGGLAVSAWAKPSTAVSPTGTPASRSRPANATANAARSRLT